MPVVGLNDFADEDEDDNKKRNELYTGGVSRGGGGSGMAVIGPDDDDDDAAGSAKEHVKDVFSQAQANAAQGSAAASGAPKRVVTMYSNGFTVDDGPFRPFDDPANASFLKDLRRGHVPRELESVAGADGFVNLELVDKRETSYEAPAYVAFGGGGQTLASDDAKPSGAAVFGGADAAATAAETPVVDEAQPKTTLQIRLASGKRLRATLNLSHTVRHIDALVRSEGGGDQKYTLLAGFPPAPLTDPEATIEAAGLKGAAITQKLL